jgi:hypothetical protein
MKYNTYENLLIELLKKMELTRFKTNTCSKDFVLMKFFIEEAICREKFENGNMQEFVKWLYC